MRSPSPTAPVQPRQKRVKFTGFVCALCDVTCNSDADVVQHLASRHHREQQQAGDQRVPAPSHVLPITRPPSLTAAAQLAAIVDLQWPGFAAETVNAMFYLRRRRAIGGFHSAQLARTSTEEDFANLVLQQPTYIQEAAKQARERLACVDLPKGTATPTLVLSAASRHKLQIDCLHRRLRWTSLRENWRLLSMVALRCVMDGTAAHLLSDRHSPFSANWRMRSGSLLAYPALPTTGHSTIGYGRDRATSGCVDTALLTSATPSSAATADLGCKTCTPCMKMC